MDGRFHHDGDGWTHAMRRRRADLLRRWERRREDRIRRMRIRLAVAMALTLGLVIPLAIAVGGDLAAGHVPRLDRESAAPRSSWCVTGMDAGSGLSMQPVPMTMRPPASLAEDIGESSGAACRSALSWPLLDVDVTVGFDAPARPWMPGHRGVDLAAQEHDDLYSPSNVVVSFAGMVAGKHVVSIRHGDLTLTFEPAVTRLPVGSAVARGERFGEVSRGSDHCDDACLHWGVRQGDEYLDPEHMVSSHRVALKPVSWGGNADWNTRTVQSLTAYEASQRGSDEDGIFASSRTADRH